MMSSANFYRLLLPLLLSLFFSAGLLAQNYNQQSYTVTTSDYKASKEKLDRLIQANHFTVIRLEETKTTRQYEFEASMSQLELIDTVVSSLGYVSNKHLTTVNNSQMLAELELQLDFLNKKKDEYNQMLKKMDSVKSDKYYQHWEKIRGIEEQIFQTKKQIKNLQSSPLCRVDINLIDEQLNFNTEKVSFINEPGVEYSYLFIDNPKKGFSLPAYQGVLLKYLFTRGKSYLSMGVMKAVEKPVNDSAALNNFFDIAFGQDFYSRRFGRGSRHFMNLYVGYQLGVSMVFKQESPKTIPFARPGLGLEILKTKNMLLETRVDYHLPLSDVFNENLRGWMGSASFSFVF